jgi:methionyl aminopeptidase
MRNRIKIKSPREIQLMRNAGKLAAEILERSGELVKPGVTTDEINTFVHDYTLRNGAYPSPLNYHGFPKSVCTSVNEVVTHGIPDNYVLAEGDIINIDVTCQLEGYHGDTSRTFFVGKVDGDTKELVSAAKECMYEGIRAAGEPNANFGDIGVAIEGLADEYGYTVVREYCGHGIGRGFHEDPLVLHYRSRERHPVIKEGMVFTIEPMINMGTHKVKTLDDGWTVVTADGELSAQFEHTLAITSNGIEVLTQL